MVTMVIGTDDIVTDLRAMGIETDDGLFVHVALGRVGYVIGGPRGLIQSLLDAVGPKGLVCMPGFSGDAYDPVDHLSLDVSADTHRHIRAQVPGYDPSLSNVRENGSVPEAFRSWPGVVRSPHPTSSVLMYGAGALTLSVPHDPHCWATGSDTPWERLRFRPRMKILLIGVGWNRCSALHAAESAAEHKRVKMRDIKLGQGPDAPWIVAPDVADDLDRLFPLVGTAWEETGNVDTGQIGDAECKLTGYDTLVEFARTWINSRNKADGVPVT